MTKDYQTFASASSSDSHEPMFSCDAVAAAAQEAADVVASQKAFR